MHEAKREQRESTGERVKNALCLCVCVAYSCVSTNSSAPGNTFCTSRSGGNNNCGRHWVTKLLAFYHLFGNFYYFRRAAFIWP